MYRYHTRRATRSEASYTKPLTELAIAACTSCAAASVLVLNSGGSELFPVSLRNSTPNIIKVSCIYDAVSCSPQVSTEEGPLAYVATVPICHPGVATFQTKENLPPTRKKPPKMTITTPTPQKKKSKQACQPPDMIIAKISGPKKKETLFFFSQAGRMAFFVFFFPFFHVPV